MEKQVQGINKILKEKLDGRRAMSTRRVYFLMKSLYYIDITTKVMKTTRVRWTVDRVRKEFEQVRRINDLCRLLLKVWDRFVQVEAIKLELERCMLLNNDDQDNNELALNGALDKLADLQLDMHTLRRTKIAAIVHKLHKTTKCKHVAKKCKSLKNRCKDVNIWHEIAPDNDLSDIVNKLVYN